MLHNSILRKIIYLLHLYIGIILGLLITLICPFRYGDCVQAGTGKIIRKGYRLCQAYFQNRSIADPSGECKT